jgi:hypothetical protein
MPGDAGRCQPVRRHGSKAGLAGLLALPVLLAGCTPGGDRPSPSRWGSPGCSVDTAARISDHGPIRTPRGSVQEGMRHRPSGSLQDVGMIPLLNTAAAPVTLDKVVLVPDPKASKVRLIAAFVSTDDAAMRIVKAGHWGRALRALRCYQLQPDPEGNHAAPLLVLRVGPALPDRVGRHRYSRNNDVNLYYHTADGKRYDVAYALQIEYPN